jgi:hypothetical protein
MIMAMGQGMDESSSSPGDSASLGLATTRELLREVEVRAATGRLDSELAAHAGALHWLEVQVTQMLVKLPPAVQDYRTVDAWERPGS